MAETGPIVVEQTFNASRERVWRALTDAEEMRQWFFETMKSFEPRAGFETVFTVHHDGRDYVHVWRVSEVTAPRRMVWDWTYRGVAGQTFVTWEVVERSGGATLTLTHSGMETLPQTDPAFTRESCSSGWKHFIVDRLKAFLENRIEKQVDLRAPVSRVWKAITNAREFGRWFGVELQGEFAAGKTIVGVFEQPIDEGKIQEFQKKCGVEPSKIKMPEKNATFCTVERVEPEQYFSFRWIPYGIDAEADPENEPTTLVEFRLQKIASGTRLTIVESGFEKVPAHRRERAFRMNGGGWEAQAQNVRKYVESA